MIIVNILQLLSLFLFCFNASFALTNVLFFPNPQNSDAISVFSKIATLLIKTNKYKCTTILHGADEKTFDQTDCEKLFYGVRGQDTYLQSLHKAQLQFDADIFWNLQAFKKTYKLQIDAFYETDILNKLQEIKVDIIVCDVQNLLCKILPSKLSITKVIYYDSTTSSPHLMDLYDFPTSYYPVSDSPFAIPMSFFDRLRNQMNYYLVTIAIKYQRRLFQQLLVEKDEELNHISDNNSIALYLTQDVHGLTHPLYLPPNFIKLGCVSCLLHNTKSLNLKKFLERRQKNIFVKFSKVKDFQETLAIIDAFIKFADVGFIIHGPLAADVETPLNVFRTDFIDTSDILGHRKIYGFISDGEYSSVLESTYFKKPIIILSYDFGKKASGALVRDKGVGIAFMDRDELTEEKLESALKEILTSRRKFESSLRKYSHFTLNSDTKNEVVNWFDYCRDNDIKSLIVESNYELSSFEHKNIDNMLVFLLILLFLVYQVYNIIKAILCRKRAKLKIKDFYKVENIENQLEPLN